METAKVTPLQKFFRFIPVPTAFGFLLSLVAVLIGWLLSINITMVFAGIVCLVCIAWTLQKDYKLPWDNNLLLVVYILLGHLPYLVFSFLFF